jgi:CBS domain-containing protein
LIDAPHDQMNVADLMTKDVVTVSQEDSVSVAARLMRDKKVHHLLVTSDGEVVGIVSSFDLLSVVEGNGFRVRSSDN